MSRNLFRTRTAGPPPNQWLVRPRPNPRAALRLFCLPYAGGGASIFRRWAERLPASIEVCAVQLPGRENRLSEEPFTRIEPLVEALGAALRDSLDRPFAFFGHSLGASVGFELARWFRRRHGLMPEALFISGRRAPQVPEGDPAWDELPDDEFIEELRSLKGTPPQVLAHPELMELVIPMLRADFAICKKYEYTSDAPLACPFYVFGGRDDVEIPRDYLEAWREHTSSSFTLRILPGEHFFLQTAEALLLEMIARDLVRLMTARTT
jgi:medium-chain acyl-[acyl-carrier-protein] hydrolase